MQFEDKAKSQKLKHHQDESRHKLRSPSSTFSAHIVSSRSQASHSSSKLAAHWSKKEKSIEIAYQSVSHSLWRAFVHLKSTFVTCLTVHYCHRHCNRLPSLLPCVSLDKKRERNKRNQHTQKVADEVLAASFHFDRVHCHIKCMRAREREREEEGCSSINSLSVK